MIIVDECHHISAFSFEQVLQAAPAKYVYGLTANTDPEGWPATDCLYAVRSDPLQG